MIKKYKNIFIIIITIIILCFFFWFRFIKTRLPAIIPFELHLSSLIIIIFVILNFCISLLFNIKNSFREQSLLNDIQIIVLKPFIYLDDSIKKNDHVQQLLLVVSNKMQQITSFNYNIFKLLKIIPKILLNILFFIDVFMLHRFDYFYKGVFLLLITLIIVYIEYSI